MCPRFSDSYRCIEWSACVPLGSYPVGGHHHRNYRRSGLATAWQIQVPQERSFPGCFGERQSPDEQQGTFVLYSALRTCTLVFVVVTAA